MLNIRKKPVNLEEKDLGIFKHELQRNFADPSVIKIKNVFITGDLHFPEKYKTNTAVAYHAKFFKPAIFKLFKKISKLKFSFASGSRLIITDEWSKSYFHWLTDCLPRLVLAESAHPGIPVLLPGHLRERCYVIQSLALLGKSNFYFLEKDKWYFLKTIYFPVHLAPTGNYNDEMIGKLRSAISLRSDTTVPDLKIYISRGKAAHRKIKNENEILPLLEKKGFKTVYCEDMSLNEQVMLFNKTRLLLTNHGAGLTNMLFMPAGATVIELRKKNDIHNNCYFSLASALNLNYYYLQCEPVNENEDAYTANTVVEPDELSQLVETVIKENNPV